MGPPCTGLVMLAPSEIVSETYTKVQNSKLTEHMIVQIYFLAE